MTSGTGQRLPILFGPADGRYEWIRSGKVSRFDPTTPTQVQIPRGQQGIRIMIGGTARPQPDQPPGGYTAVLSIVVSYAGA